MSPESTPIRRGLLAHPGDMHCVVYHLLSLAAYGSAFWLYLHPVIARLSDRASSAAFVAAASIVLGWISGVDVGVNFHNHAHRRVFTAPWLNRWFGRIWTVSGGWPSYFWEYSHLTVHHARLLESDDWTLPRRRSDGRWEGYYTYLLAHWPWRYAFHLWRDFSANKALRRKALWEFAIFAALWSVPFWIDVRMALWLWVLPQWLGNVFLLGPGMWVQHVGCVPKTAAAPMRHSNIFLSGAFNMVMFNIGYHLEHHDFPGVHWTELPVLHARLSEDLAKGSTHIVPYGYYHAVYLMTQGEEGLEQFLRAGPDLD